MHESHSERNKPPAGGRAYTGETLVVPRRRVAPPSSPPPPSPSSSRPRPVRRRLWPRIRLVLLLALGFGLLVLVLLYMQVRSLASDTVVADARPGPVIASPLGGINILLIGVDERPGNPEEGVRGDTLIVAHLDAAGRWASLLSIPRDSIVSIRDIGDSKINAAYGYGYLDPEGFFAAGTSPRQGGMALAAETVEQFLGLRIDYVAQVNFDGFAKIIDILGGVTIDVPYQIIDEEYPTPDFGVTRIEFQPGVQEMDGATALIYARTRHADSDFGRSARQQQVIRAMIDKLRAHGPLGQALLLPRLREGLNGTVVTTLPIDRPDALVGLASLAGGLDPDTIVRLQISPETVPGYREEGTDVYWDQAGVHALVERFLTPPGVESENARVQVLNGTGVSGLAGRTTAELERQGFIVLPAGDAPSDAVPQTIVYDLTGKPYTASRLAQILNAELREGIPEGVASDADIIVVLGGTPGSP